MADRSDETDLFMSVRLDEGRRLCKVLVSSQTTGQSVIELLKPDDDNVYYLVEVWKGCERPISHEEKLQNVLLQWGSDVDDVIFMLKRKHSPRKTSMQRQSKSPRNSPVPDELQEKQQKVDNLEKEVQQKEKHLKSLRNKESSKNSLKTKYVHLLESRVIEQEERLMSLQSIQDEMFKCQVDNEKLVLELNRLRSMFVLKHQQLTEANAQVELLSRELAKKSQENSQQHNGYASSNLNNQRPSKDILFMKHGIVQDHDNLNSLLSWQNDEENDTETSADSGHVSNDSPSYQNKLGASFQYFPTPPEMYCGNLECFDIEQELGKNQGRVKTQDLMGSSKVDGWHRTKESAFTQANLTQTFDQQLFVNTDFKQGSVGSLLRYQQMNRDSPQSISSFSSLSSESSLAQSFPKTYSSLPRSGTYPLPDRAKSRNSSSKITTPTNEQKAFISNDSPEKRSSNTNGRDLNTKRSELNTNRSETKSKQRELNARSVQINTKQSEVCTSDRDLNGNRTETNSSRTAGSISHYQRKRGDSLDNSNPLTLGALNTDRRSSQTSNSSSEGSIPRVRTPSIEKPSVPNSLPISNKNESRLSPTATNSLTSPNFNQRVKSPTSSKRSVTQQSTQNGRSLSPMALDFSSQKNTPQSLQRAKSPLSKDRFIPGTKEGHSSPETLGPRGTSSESGFDSSPSGSVDSKGRSSPQVFDSRVENTTVTSGKLPVQGGTLPSPVVQELLNDMTSLKVTTRDVKPIQIQTRAEKDSDNIPTEKMAIETTVEAKLPVDSKAKSVVKPPKPLPRKRTKTPPARGSGISNNPASKTTTAAVTSSQRNRNSNIEEQGPKEKTGSGISGGDLGARSYDSILRRSKGKGGKKSGKRVSLDPHAVLLHASLEGELELVKNIIHQVEDPSYPNNEGLTALHHAVCNSHDDIVKFLVDYGCDINAADMQGWTSLHCAAANNSTDMCKFLINRGACVFAVTSIEGKTPSRCCEKDSDNYEQCFSYLSDLENNFGLSNEGVVYSVYAYQASRKDELSFECGERLTVIRRGDVTEKEWWWARDTRNHVGYIPRNLLGVQPTVAPDV